MIGSPTVLVLRALGLGDLLVAVPALRALRAAFGDHRLLLAAPAWLRPFVELVGGWDELVPTPGLGHPLPRRLAGVTVAVNLHGNGAASAATLEALAPRRRIGHRRPGWSGPEWIPELPERRRWCRLLIEHGVPADEEDLLLAPPPVRGPAPGAVLVHPGAAYGAKRWPPERFAEVASACAGAGHHVVVTGSHAERGVARLVARLAGLPDPAMLAGRTGGAALAALVAEARAVISGDTGIAHLAVAYRTPSLTLYGPVTPARWGPPPGGPHRVLGGERGRTGDPFAARPDTALLAVTVQDVLASAADLGVLRAATGA